MAAKQTPKTQKAKPRSRVKAPAVTQRPTYAELRQQLAGALEREKAALKKLQDRDQQLAHSAKELQDWRRQLTEALEQQTATSGILRVIATSPTDIQPVLDTIAENAARVCGSYDAVIRLVDGDKLRLAAHFGPVEPGFGRDQPLTRGSVNGRAVIDRKLIHVQDSMAIAAAEFPESVRALERSAGHTVLAAPLLRAGVPIGVSSSGEPKSLLSQISRLNCLKLLPIRQSSPLRMFGCSKNCRSATQNCARH